MANAEVVAYEVSGDVVIVSVTCPNGCRSSNRRDSKPKTHTHGWTAPTGEYGGDRAAHCPALSAGYTLHWTGGPPADAKAALKEVRRARKA